MDELYHHTMTMITQGTRMIGNAPCKSSPDCCYHRLTMYTDDADLDVVDSNVSVGNMYCTDDMPLNTIGMLQGHNWIFADFDFSFSVAFYKSKER